MNLAVIILLSILILAPLSPGAQTVHARRPLSKKPNIIFILVDDQGYGDLGVFFQNQRAKTGKPYERSPNLDRLAAEGAMLTQHYAAAPVCAPSRASILLGLSQGHCNVRDNQFDKALEDNYTMASTLHATGYNTAAIGKWGLQGDKRWDKNGADWPARPRNRGFDYFFGYMRHEDGHQHYPKEGLYTGKKQVWENDTDIADQLDKCYTADLWTAAAKKWIVDQEKGTGKNKPFFLYLAYETPHAVTELPTQEYPDGGGLQGGMQWLGVPGHFITTAMGEPDSYIHPDYANATYDNDSNSATAQVPWPNTYKRYATANRRIDDGVGDLMQLLKDLHIDSTTLIVYTSDNGPSIETYLGKEKWEEQHLPVFFSSYGPFDGIKRDNWEGGVRMPAIAAWPGHIPAGKVVTSPSISYDWLPTFLDAAREPAPARIDGVSLLPSLTGKGKQHYSNIYIEYDESGRTPDYKEFAPDHRGRIRNQMQLLRLGDYVGVRYNVQSADDPFEIYDVVTDPQELKNLVVTNTTNSSGIKGIEAYMKAHVLQIRRPDFSAPRPYDSALVPAVDKRVVRGILWKKYNGMFPWIPQEMALHPSEMGFVSHPRIDVSRQKTEGMLYFEGYIRVPENGDYSFWVSCGTKALLRIHDAQLIDEDFGYESGNELKSSMLLKAGLHPFRLYYECRNKHNALNLDWSGPGISRQEISAGYFFRDK